ncbi:Sec-independent protein translocase protein TatB [Nitrosococcus oceani]|uniref:Sec-independent protein translocase protein TatB n=2 Tax=Nitrosococcus oceani TaxID=1229 RepID=Q3J6P6_NITOC|nr:Sec-independent protein translocase protein TatB [Nitrosococcus oceani]KFI18067.1 preprotein translocase subunit TatA [Nitrosococcus oceani C-27]ABA59500.1 Sec-independent protein translocase TatB [Nitrosococcus oceani ATCC 19707]EDZ66338.1 twin arginine-targeting protein translocase TatB [Nitrosococcus oceani AFC27]KFI21306.1 preprotein translocase subunit TatA [Nitrosococcus oceani]GEM21372.1 twin-arginine translocase subunit TatB [Nitrosococcus oceani]
MFDIGFWEILVILVILLIVVGPERLPAVARTTALWIRKARRFVSQVKQEVEEELRAEELRQSLEKNKNLFDLDETISEKPTPKPKPSYSKTPDDGT